MTGIFDLIPIVTVVLFAFGLVGVIVYERSRSKSTEESNS
jgi:hypothetical protein